MLEARVEGVALGVRVLVFARRGSLQRYASRMMPIINTQLEGNSLARVLNETVAAVTNGNAHHAPAPVEEVLRFRIRLRAADAERIRTGTISEDAVRSNLVARIPAELTDVVVECCATRIPLMIAVSVRAPEERRVELYGMKYSYKFSVQRFLETRILSGWSAFNSCACGFILPTFSCYLKSY
ncbi:uncharacterized protein LOC129583415 [Paramacrobiotus metropolitanus]|uniref:uncharacterized protein LOC129583415 n=1 Tax=Paramacrobiotus metropolitanus TaxID=2943436 RepID=UPI002445A4F2|nr:uncharacterized protein LOC129583415 [Paramacrobiotus metropolitanus]